MENIKFNKLLDDKYSLMSDIAKKYNYNDKLLSMITFIYVAFYLDFGKEVDFPLYDLFNRVRIIYEEGNVSEIAKGNNNRSVQLESENKLLKKVLANNGLDINKELQKVLPKGQGHHFLFSRAKQWQA